MLGTFASAARAELLPPTVPTNASRTHLAEAKRPQEPAAWCAQTAGEIASTAENGKPSTSVFVDWGASYCNRTGAGQMNSKARSKTRLHSYRSASHGNPASRRASRGPFPLIAPHHQQYPPVESKNGHHRDAQMNIAPALIRLQTAAPSSAWFRPPPRDQIREGNADGPLPARHDQQSLCQELQLDVPLFRAPQRPGASLSRGMRSSTVTSMNVSSHPTPPIPKVKSADKCQQHLQADGQTHRLRDETHPAPNI